MAANSEQVLRRAIIKHYQTENSYADLPASSETFESNAVARHTLFSKLPLPRTRVEAKVSIDVTYATRFGGAEGIVMAFAPF